MKRLAIITTHPIQYNAPWFAMLAKEPDVDLKVFYTWSQRETDFFDATFGSNIEWDIPLLEGYSYKFVPNKAKNPNNKKFNGIQCPTLINEIKEYNPTHILIFGWNFHAHFKAMRYFKGKIPILFRGDSTLLDYENSKIKDLVSRKNKTIKDFVKSTQSYIKYKIRKNVLSLVYSYVDKALYVGTNNKKYFLNHGLKESQLFFAPHAIDNSRFMDYHQRAYEKKALKWRQEIGIKKEDIVVLFAGKFESKKNPEILLDAIFQINQQKNNFIKLIFLGSGPLEADLKEKAKGNSNIIFLPLQNQTKMPIVYRLCDIFCLPSQGPGETWGLAINEALASNRSVIISDKVGCAIDLASEPNKIFISNDIDDLVRKLKELIKQLNKNSISFENFQRRIEKWSFQELIEGVKKALKD